MAKYTIYLLVISLLIIMPIQAQVKMDIVKKVKTEKGPLKLGLISLFKSLIDVYKEDDRYLSSTNKISYEAHHKIKELSLKALSLLNNQREPETDELLGLDKFFTIKELKSKAFKEPISALPISHDFWLQILLRIPKLGKFITDRDEDVLEYLDHVETFKYENNAKMTIEFTFRPNPFFTNTKLRLDTTEDEEDDVEISKVRSSLIKWKQGQNYLVTSTEYRKNGKVRTRETRHASFFWIFKNYNANDFNGYMDDSYIEDDLLSDEGLFNMTSDIIYVIMNDLFVYLIPTYYDIEVPQLNEETDYDDSEYESCDD